MRDRKEIEEERERIRVNSSSVHHDIYANTKLSLEVLLDIRDLLAEKNKNHQI